MDKSKVLELQITIKQREAEPVSTDNFFRVSATDKLLSKALEKRLNLYAALVFELEQKRPERKQKRPQRKEEELEALLLRSMFLESLGDYACVVHFIDSDNLKLVLAGMAGYLGKTVVNIASDMVKEWLLKRSNKNATVMLYGPDGKVLKIVKTNTKIKAKEIKKQNKTAKE